MTAAVQREAGPLAWTVAAVLIPAVLIAAGRVLALEVWPSYASGVQGLKAHDALPGVTGVVVGSVPSPEARRSAVTGLKIIISSVGVRVLRPGCTRSAVHGCCRSRRILARVDGWRFQG